MHRDGLSSGSEIKGYKIICYPEQLDFVQEFFGDLVVEYATVTMDEVERVLELDSPSLIE